MLDFVVENFIELIDGAVVILSDFFKELSKLLSGDAELLDGHARISISSVSIDLLTTLVTFINLLTDTK